MSMKFTGDIERERETERETETERQRPETEREREIIDIQQFEISHRQVSIVKCILQLNYIAKIIYV